jgi:hypothetical protein
VTGVQTCALPISNELFLRVAYKRCIYSQRVTSTFACHFVVCHSVYYQYLCCIFHMVHLPIGASCVPDKQLETWHGIHWIGLNLIDNIVGGNDVDFTWIQCHVHRDRLRSRICLSVSIIWLSPVTIPITFPHSKQTLPLLHNGYYGSVVAIKYIKIDILFCIDIYQLYLRHYSCN